MRIDITCKDCVDLLMDYVDHTLTPEAEKKLDEHLSSCPPCIHFLKTYKKCADFTGRLSNQEVQIPRELENRLKSFLKDELSSQA